MYYFIVKSYFSIFLQKIQNYSLHKLFPQEKKDRELQNNILVQLKNTKPIVNNIKLSKKYINPTFLFLLTASFKVR